MTKAYVLIETSVGAVTKVADSLRGIPEVLAVDTVTGPYDIVAVVEAPDLNAVGEVVTGTIHAIGGILRTVTCLSIST